MLQISLAISFAILLVLILTAYTESRPMILASVCCAILAWLVAFCAQLGYFPAVGVQSILLVFVISPLWQIFRWKPSRFVWMSLVGTLIAYGYASMDVVAKQRELALMQAAFPQISVEDRVPYLAVSTNVSSPYVNEGLKDFEKHLDLRGLSYDVRSRNHSLSLLHDHAVQNFANSWGFGFERMPVLPSANHLASDDSDAVPIRKRSDIPVLDRSAFHQAAVMDFLDPIRFGYVRDRQHVAGFQSHRFSTVPESKEWEVARLELVSLLLHNEPSVYLSERLPQMDALKGVPTRPLDAFETDGLAALRKGEDLFIREDRMLGAIRNVKQCIGCHGGERGQLLGAFTYTLRPTR